MNPQEPIYEGPKCACDEKQIRKIRALLRSTIDDETIAKPKEWLDQYKGIIVDTVENAAERAKECLGGEYPRGVLAVSLISGITRLLGPDYASRRISVVLSNDNILPPQKRRDAEQRLAGLHHSPVHAIYHQQREHRPLWTCFEKPKGARFQSEGRHVTQLYKVKCPEAAQNYAQIADVVCQRTNEKAIKTLLSAVGRYLTSQPVFDVFDSQQDRMKALIDAAQAFTTAPGRYLWVFGFDVDKPPSPYRAVVVSTSEKVECDLNWRRWLNTLAAILGDIAAVERSMAIFVNSVKAKAFAVKRNEENWKQISKTHEIQKELCTQEMKLKKKKKLAEAETVRAIRDLLPKT